MKNLEVLSISKSYKYNIDINFDFLKKLKKYIVNEISLAENIQKLVTLEEFSFIPKFIYNSNYENYERRLIELILSNQTLKKINIELLNIDNKTFNDINYKNLEINDITLNLKNNTKEIDINKLIKKFSNIKKLKIENKSKFNIKEPLIINDNSIIIEELEMPYPFFPLYFSFSKIKNLSIKFQEDYYDILKKFCLFSNKCSNFNSLESLDISIRNFPIEINILNNFSNNIGYFHNVKRLSFEFCVEKMNERIYYNLINKLLSLNLLQLNISFHMEKWDYKYYKYHYMFYTKNELKKVFSNKIKELSIYKIQKLVENIEDLKKNCSIF